MNGHELLRASMLKLIELAHLQPGWYISGNPIPSKTAFRNAAKFIVSIVGETDNPVHEISAADDGKIRVTWPGISEIGPVDIGDDSKIKLSLSDESTCIIYLESSSEEIRKTFNSLLDDPQAWPNEGDLVRYSCGSTALAILGKPHAGGWHGDQCMGGFVFFSEVHKPTVEDMKMWLKCSSYRNTKEADNRIARILAELVP